MATQTVLPMSQCSRLACRDRGSQRQKGASPKEQQHAEAVQQAYDYRSRHTQNFDLHLGSARRPAGNPIAHVLFLLTYQVEDYALQEHETLYQLATRIVMNTCLFQE